MLTSLLAVAWPELGKTPRGAHAEQLKKSPNYDKKTQRFVNRQQAEYDRVMRSFDVKALMKKQIFGSQISVPKQPLPEMKPNLPDFLAAQSLQYHWLGHSTILLRLDQKTILMDPVFTNAAPVPLAVQRFQKPVLPLAELPDIDLILISHDHYDHLDKRSVQFFRNTKTHFIVPLGVSSYLIGWGIAPENITELDWWQEINKFDLRIACTPSQHFSGRTGPWGNQTLWASWVVMGATERFYFSGDSGYDIHFREIGNKYGPFDIAFMESGQYNDIWPMTHLFPQESVAAGLDLQAKRLQPIHWGMFNLSTHDWFEPANEVLRFAANKNIEVVVPKIGEAVKSTSTIPLQRWWQ